MECGRRRIVINIPVPDAALWKGEPRFVIIAGKYPPGKIRGMAGGSATGLTRSESSFSRDERPKLRQENNNPSGLQSLGTLPFGSLYLNPRRDFGDRLSCMWCKQTS